jgi:hypothetical protein
VEVPIGGQLGAGRSTADEDARRPHAHRVDHLAELSDAAATVQPD